MDELFLWSTIFFWLNLFMRFFAVVHGAKCNRPNFWYRYFIAHCFRAGSVCWRSYEVSHRLVFDACKMWGFILEFLLSEAPSSQAFRGAIEPSFRRRHRAKFSEASSIITFLLKASWSDPIINICSPWYGKRSSMARTTTKSSFGVLASFFVLGRAVITDWSAGPSGYHWSSPHPT